MKKLQHLSGIFLALLLLIGTTTCKNDDDDGPMPPADKNLVEIAMDEEDFSILVDALVLTGLDQVIKDAQNITVFAPNNAAFTALLQDLGFESLQDIDQDLLTEILKYHVLGQKYFSSGLETGYYQTLADDTPGKIGAYLFFNKGNSSPSVNGESGIIDADISGSNGVIHSINKVLLPPTVVDLAVYNPDFSILVQAVIKANLVDALKATGPFTVFAPTNQAFEMLFSSLGITGIDDLTAEQLEPILKYHVITPANVLSSQLTSGMVETLNGKSLDIAVNGSEVTINGSAMVVAADVQGSNGVVHAINKVLVPEDESTTTVVDIATSNSDFSILVEALSKTNLVGALSQEDASFTVFAPTNMAFEKLLSALGASSLDDFSVEELTTILLYHVMGSKVTSGDLSNGYFPTLATFENNNISLYVTLDDGSVMLNKASTVTTADIMADNGVVHIIDEILIPPTIVDIAIANNNFSILVQAVVKAGLVDALKGDGPLTVFAPTNAAFEALFTSLGITGIDDLTAEQLQPILLYHVVSDNILSSDLTSGMVPTLNTSADLDIQVGGGTVTINGASTVVAADIQGKNGVVHVIDAVLIP